MSQTYATVLRKNLAKPLEAPRFYAVGRSGHVVFHPGKDLRKLCKNMEYTAAGKPAADSGDGGGGSSDLPDDNTPSGGGGDDGEAPDPAA